MDLQQAGKAQSVSAADVNREMRQIESEFKQGLQEIKATKQKLITVIECYKYFLDKTNKARVDQAIREEISVLQKYKETQLKMIKRLEQKSVENQYTAIACKIPKLSAELQKVLGMDELLKLLVTLDFEAERLESRKEEVKKRIRAREVASSKLAR